MATTITVICAGWVENDGTKQHVVYGKWSTDHEHGKRHGDGNLLPDIDAGRN